MYGGCWVNTCNWGIFARSQCGVTPQLPESRAQVCLYCCVLSISRNAWQCLPFYPFKRLQNSKENYSEACLQNEFEITHRCHVDSKYFFAGDNNTFHWYSTLWFQDSFRTFSHWSSWKFRESTSRLCSALSAEILKSWEVRSWFSELSTKRKPRTLSSYSSGKGLRFNCVNISWGFWTGVHFTISSSAKWEKKYYLPCSVISIK